MKRQKIVRVYPTGYIYEEDVLKVLNEFLNDGWEVRHITLVETDRSGRVIHDYIIEKNFKR
jgi:hypothetical protein